MSYPYLAKTTLKYKSPHATDLSFAKGDTIRVTGPSPDDEDWLVGETMDGSAAGGFPKDFIEALEGEEAGGAAGTNSSGAAAAPAVVPVPQKEEAAAAEAPEDPSSLPKDAPAPPSPKLAPAELPPSTPASPGPQPPSSPPAKPAQTSDSTQSSPKDPSKMSMKDRLAFFNAAQTKAAPPPVKPKPAGTGGMTWSQRQKLKQEQEAKEKAEGGAATATPTKATETPSDAQPPSPTATTATPTKATVASSLSPPVSPGGGARAGMSAADAATSIGGAGSLKERMAALRNAGAFGQKQEETPPAPKPSGKVWSRPPAPEPEFGEEGEEGAEAGSVAGEGARSIKSPGDEAGDGLAAAGAAEGEGGEEEEDEEAKEKARKAAIAARMAKIGARGPMGMPPPKPARKPTREAIPAAAEAPAPAAPTTMDDKPKEVEAAESTEKAEDGSEAPAGGAAPTSIPIAAMPRRTAGPRRRGAPPRSGPDRTGPAKEQSLETKDEDGNIEPPPQVMVADEEKPLPLTEEGKQKQAEEIEAGQGSEGAKGAEAAGIALTSSRDGGETHGEEATDKEAGTGKGFETEEKTLPERREELRTERETEAGHDLEHSSGAIAAAGTADDHEEEGEEDEEEGEAPPPPPRLAKEEQQSEAEAQHDAEGEGEEEDDDDAPPPPVPGNRPGGPRAMPSAVGAAIVPPPPQSAEQHQNAHDEGPAADDAEEPKGSEAEEDAPAPPPRRPSVQIPPAAAAVPSVASSAQPVSTSPTTTKSPTAAESPRQEQAVPEEDAEKTRRSGIAARMAKLGGVKFGMPPPIRKKSSMSSPETPLSPRGESAPSVSGGMGSATVEEPGEVEETGPKSPVGEMPSPIAKELAATGDDDESEEAQTARRQKILERLKGQGTLGFGMFHHGPASPSVQHEDPRGLQAEPEELDEAPPPPPGRPGAGQPSEEDDEDVPPPPPPGRRDTATSNRALPPPPAGEEDEEEDAAPPPPSRPVRSPTSEVPPSPSIASSAGRPPVPSPGRRTSQITRQGTQTSIPSSPARSGTRDEGMPRSSGDYSISNEPAVMMMNQSSSPPPPPPPPGGAPPATPPPAQVNRSTSTLSKRSATGSGFTPASRQGSRMSNTAPIAPPISLGEQAPASPAGSVPSSDPAKRGSVSSTGAKPGFKELQAASQDSGVKLFRAAKSMFDQGKKGFYGDGSPAGFVSVAMDSAHIARGQESWGQLVYEQDANSVLRKHDDPRQGDIAALHDARFKGRKGLQSYDIHVGSVQEPLVGVISEYDTKGKHKFKLLQVERGVPGEVSYRCDDLKSGKVVVYRPGV